jgi:redox-sensitive bicupin YhaK (pirin superfamily)
MIEIRTRETLGQTSRGWLTATLHFSIGDVGNTAFQPIDPLVVWNDDQFDAKSGFPMHAHSNMEILTYVRSGAITHTDSLGNEGRIEAGCIQLMSAGSGIRHSEMNLEEVPTTLFQIWLRPRNPDGDPSWTNLTFPKRQHSGSFVTLASGFGELDVPSLGADARILAATIPKDGRAEHRPAFEKAYLVCSSGSVEINGNRVNAGDGVYVQSERELQITATDDSELVMVELGNPH